MRLMYDSTRPMEIPATAQMVLVYVDGIYAGNWAQERVHERFKYAKKVTCSAIGRVQAQVYDVEPDCIWPMENVLDLVARDWSQGLNPTVYINQQNHWHAARQMFQRAFQREPQWFVANYDGDPKIPDGAVAKQYAHPADPPGSEPSGPWELPFHADVSAVRDYWPGVDNEEEDMPTADEVANAVVAKLLDKNLYLLDERPGVPEGERHNTTLINALWSTWHTMHFGDPVNGLYPSNKDILDAVEASGVTMTPEQMEAFAVRMESVMKTLIAKGVASGMQTMHAVFAPRPVEGT